MPSDTHGLSQSADVLVAQEAVLSGPGRRPGYGVNEAPTRARSPLPTYTDVAQRLNPASSMPTTCVPSTTSGIDTGVVPTTRPSRATSAPGGRDTTSMEPRGETSDAAGIVVGGVGADRVVAVPESGSTAAAVPDGVPTGRSSHASFVAPAPADTAENGAGASALLTQGPLVGAPPDAT